MHAIAAWPGNQGPELRSIIVCALTINVEPLRVGTSILLTLHAMKITANIAQLCGGMVLHSDIRSFQSRHLCDESSSLTSSGLSYAPACSEDESGGKFCAFPSSFSDSLCFQISTECRKEWKERVHLNSSHFKEVRQPPHQLAANHPAMPAFVTPQTNTCLAAGVSATKKAKNSWSRRRS